MDPNVRYYTEQKRQLGSTESLSTFWEYMEQDSWCSSQKAINLTNPLSYQADTSSALRNWNFSQTRNSYIIDTESQSHGPKVVTLKS